MFSLHVKGDIFLLNASFAMVILILICLAQQITVVEPKSHQAADICCSNSDANMNMKEATT